MTPAYCFRKVSWAFFLLIGFGWPGTGDGQPVDSLAHRLQATYRDTAYVRTQAQAVWQFLQRSKFTQADSLLTKSEELANRLDDAPGKFYVLYYRALASYYQDQITKGLPYAHRALAVVNQYNLAPRERQLAMSLHGVLYFSIHRYAEALRYYLDAIRLTENHNLSYRVTPAYLGAGNVLKVMGKNKEALVYYRKALTAASREIEPRMLVLAENHLGDSLSELGEAFANEALQHYLHALPVAERSNAHGPTADLLTNIGRMYLMLNKPDKALPYLTECEKLAETDNLLDQLGTNDWVFGQVYARLGEAVRAETYLKKSLALAKQIDDAEGMRVRIQTLASFYADRGNFAKAYAYQRQKAVLNDSLFTVQDAQHAQEMITRYETQKKEQQLTLLKARADRDRLERKALLTVGVLILLLLGALTAWYLYRSRLKQALIREQMRQRIAHDLHDEVGSTLSSISLLSGLIGTQLTANNTDAAARMVQKIHTDARQTLESMDEIIWTVNPGNDSLQRVILRIQEYAQPLMEAQHIAFSLHVDPHLHDQQLPMDVRQSLYFVMKEAINNLLKYAEASEVVVQIRQKQGQLRVTIADNGRGFNPQLTDNRTGRQSMQQRAEAIGGQLLIESVPGRGTNVSLSAPFQ
ncbi:ATP-binding protein [Fibrella arboris]|uniref:ATP-binding protein n=1 Tax=Fibrella arboris TaxID=3242486 RepID=UPI0035227F7F